MRAIEGADPETTMRFLGNKFWSFPLFKMKFVVKYPKQILRYQAMIVPCDIRLMSLCSQTLENKICVHNDNNINSVWHLNTVLPKNFGYLNGQIYVHLPYTVRRFHTKEAQVRYSFMSARTWGRYHKGRFEIRFEYLRLGFSQCWRTTNLSKFQLPASKLKTVHIFLFSYKLGSAFLSRPTYENFMTF